MPRSIFTDPAFKRAPNAELQRLLRGAPVQRMRLPLLGDTWLAVSADAVRQLLTQQALFVREPSRAGRRNIPGLKWWMPRSLTILADNMLSKDEPEHGRLRGLVDQAFQRSNVHAMHDPIRDLADQLLSAFPATSPVDICEQFARRLPLDVIIRLLGLPAGDAALCSGWAKRLTNAGSVAGLVRAAPSIRRLMKYLRIQFRRGDELAPGLVRELVLAEHGGSRLHADELLAMVFLLLLAGHETTTHLITLSALTLLTRPDLRERWTEDEQVRPRAVDELLRYLSPVQFSKPRFAVQEMEFCSVRIRRGEFVIALLASANLDPQWFADPGVIDFDRPIRPHFGFGGGIHFCLGAQLARMETEIALTQLFTKFPRMQLAVPEDQLRWPGRIAIRMVRELPVRLE